MRTHTKLALLTAIGLGLSACGGGGGGSAHTGSSGNISLTVTGDGVTGSGQASLDIAVTNVAEINDPHNTNGSTSIDVDADYTVTGSINATGPGGSISESINYSGSLTAPVTTADAIAASGIPTSYSETFSVTQDGITVSGSASYNINQGALRTDIGVVDGIGTSDFFMTNGATGDAESATTVAAYNVNYNNITNSTLKSQVQAAHNAGWTGKGFDIELSNHADAQAAAIAPGAEKYTSTNNKAYVCKDTAGKTGAAAWCMNNSHVYWSGSNRNKNAATTALVWHKFDTLNGSQVYSIMDGTRNSDSSLNLSKALSPIGNLN